MKKIITHPLRLLGAMMLTLLGFSSCTKPDDPYCDPWTQVPGVYAYGSIALYAAPPARFQAAPEDGSTETGRTESDLPETDPVETGLTAGEQPVAD